MHCFLGGTPETLHLFVCMSCWACSTLALIPKVSADIAPCSVVCRLLFWDGRNGRYTSLCMQGIYGGQAFGLKFLHTLEEPSHRENAVNEIVVGAAARGNECESPAR